MSGVLDRMAKRALGTLPTVQPLTSPHFAAPAPVWNESMAEPEANLEVEVPAPRRKSVQSISQQAETVLPEPNPEAVGNDEKSGAPQRHESLPQPEGAGTRRAKPENQSEDELNSGNRPSLNRKPALEPAHAGEHVVETKEYTTRTARIEPDVAEVKNGTQLPARLDKQTLALETQEILAREKEDRPVTAALELPRAAARPLPAQQRDAAAPVEHRTEIQISIGSIELRAPRAEAGPQLQPFRPRVTLDEFLRRKPEAGA